MTAEADEIGAGVQSYIKLRNDAVRYQWILANMYQVEKIIKETGDGPPGDWATMFHNRLTEAMRSAALHHSEEK